MLNSARKIISLIILVLGVALVVRTLLVAGSFTFSAGLVAGVAFTVYGGVRLLCLKDDA